MPRSDIVDALDDLQRRVQSALDTAEASFVSVQALQRTFVDQQEMIRQHVAHLTDLKHLMGDLHHEASRAMYEAEQT